MVGFEGVGENAGVVSALEGVYGGLDGVGSRAGSDRDGCLKYDAAAVALAAYVVYGDSCFGIAGFDYCAMYVPAVHAFTAVFGEQRWVYVDDASGVAFKQEVGYHQ